MQQLMLALVGLLIAPTVVAQHDSYDSASHRNGLNLKFDLLSLLDPRDPAFMFSAEYWVRPDLSINHEAGLVLGLSGEDGDAEFEGYKMRHSLRWYLEDESLSSDSRLYTSLNFMYRYLAVTDRFTLGYDCAQFGMCEYLKNYIGTVRTDRYGLQIRIGFQSHLSSRMLFEADAGLGYQYYDLRRSSINGGRFVESGRFFNESDFGWKPFLTLSWKLGFVLVKVPR